MSTIGELADKLYEIRARRVVAEAEVTKIQDEYVKVELQIYDLADAQKTSVGKGKTGSFSIGKAVVPQVKDWDKFLKFIYRHKYGHLLERRPSVTACRELWDTKGAVPGVEKFEKRKINLRGVDQA